MKRIRKIHVSQYGCTWSLTPEAWRKAVEAAVAGQSFNWDQNGIRLARKLSKWDRQFHTLDWGKEEWEYQLAILKEQAGETK